MASSSSGSSSGTSTSTAHVEQTPQSEWSLQLSQMLAALGNSMVGWAQNAYNHGQVITDGVINNLNDVVSKAGGLANYVYDQYVNQWGPEASQYLQDVETLDSNQRKQFMMGQAESTAGQADTQAMNEIERQLQGYGINVNSGRMTSQMQAMRLADAASRAGAGTQASLALDQQARQGRAQAVQLGQNMPGMVDAALQAKMGALNAQEQAILGLINSGANAMNVPANYFNDATRMQNPLVVPGSQSQQRSQQSSQSQDPGGSGGRNNNNQRQPSDGSGGNHNDTGSRYPYQPPGGGVTHPAAGKLQPNPFGQQNVQKYPYDDMDKDKDKYVPGMDMEFDPLKGYQPPEPGMDKEFNPFGDMQTPTGMDAEFNPFGDMQTPTGMDQEFNPFGDMQTPTGMDQEFNPFQDWDTTGSVQQEPQSGMDQEFNQWAGQEDTQQQYQPDFSQFDQFDQQPQEPDYGGSYDMGGDMSGGWDEYGGSGDYGYAQGGNVPKQGGVLPTTGGNVPRSASPSGGRQTDDIPARLNAGEYVIPKDVVGHFGTRHFDDVIAKSRKLRTGMAGPKPQATQKPALRMKPTFTSRYTGA